MKKYIRSNATTTGSKNIEASEYMTYQFPELTTQDIDVATEYNLIVNERDDGDVDVSGRKSDLYAYAHDYLGYELNDEYISSSVQPTNDEIYERKFTTLEEFDPWEGAIYTKNRIMDLGLDKKFDNMISEMYPNGVSLVKVNDLLWFDDDWVYESLGVKGW